MSTCFLCGQPGATKFDTHDRWLHEGGCPRQDCLLCGRKGATGYAGFGKWVCDGGCQSFVRDEVETLDDSTLAAIRAAPVVRLSDLITCFDRIESPALRETVTELVSRYIGQKNQVIADMEADHLHRS